MDFDLNPVCEWTGGKRTVKNTLTGQYMSGITKILKKCFYPEYQWKTANLGNAVVNGTRNEVKQTVTTTSKRRRFSAARYGNLVDGQVKSANDVFGDLPETKMFKMYLRVNKLIVVANQFPVCLTELNLCTRIDVLAYNPVEKRYFIIELKTGYKTNRFQFSQEMRTPFQELTNCPVNQHYLQLHLSSLMFKENFPCKNFTSRLVYATAEKFYEYKVPNPVRHQTLAFLNVLKDFMTRSVESSHHQKRTSKKRKRRKKYHQPWRANEKLTTPHFQFFSSKT